MLTERLIQLKALVKNLLRARKNHAAAPDRAQHEVGPASREMSFVAPQTEPAPESLASEPLPSPAPAPSPISPSMGVSVEEAATTPSLPIPTTPRTIPARSLHDRVQSEQALAAPWLLLPAHRDYRLYIPARPTGSAPLPLVVMIHGCRQEVDSFIRGTGMNRLADRHGFAVLYPEQAQLANLRRCWNWFDRATASGEGECALVLEMIREATRKAAIADAEVVVAGLSSGGALAALLAFQHPARFRAVAVHSGLPPVWPISATEALSVMKRGPGHSAETMAARYWQARGPRGALPPPLLVLHGDQDRRVAEINAGALVSLWRSLYESAPEPVLLTSETRQEAASAERFGTTRTRYQHQGRCLLEGIRIHGLGHAWCGGEGQEPYFEARGPKASELIWSFFAEALARQEA